MIYLTGTSTPETRTDNRSDLGLIVQPGYGAAEIKHYDLWAADNGCFAKGDSFDAEKWLAWLDKLPRVGCVFATAPDVVGDAAATWERSLPYLAQIRAMDFPAALVAQDGFWSVDIDWDAFDVLFIGGTDTFKESDDARRAVAEAKRRGKWCHMGRVNSFRRLQLAAWWGCDSADGTFLAFGPDANVPRLDVWLRRLKQPDLFFVEAS